MIEFGRLAAPSSREFATKLIMCREFNKRTFSHRSHDPVLATTSVVFFSGGVHGGKKEQQLLLIQIIESIAELFSPCQIFITKFSTKKRQNLDAAPVTFDTEEIH